MRFRIMLTLAAALAIGGATAYTLVKPKAVKACCVPPPVCPPDCDKRP